MKRLGFALLISIILTIAPKISSAASAENVLVVMNKNVPQSVEIGEYYQNKRGIPQQNMVYLDFRDDQGNPIWFSPKANKIPYDSFNKKIKTPLQNYLVQNNLKDKILYIVMTYGVPYTLILESGVWDTIRSIDSYLVDLFDEYGTTNNPYFSAKQHFNRTNGYKGYLVTRLDGPLAETEDPLQYLKNLVDSVLWAENNLNLNSGTAYIDGPRYYEGSTYLITKTFGFKSVLDTDPYLIGSPSNKQNPGHFSDALWYTGSYSLFYYDAFDWKKGAIAYHINSWSAVDIREKFTYQGETDWTWVPGLIRDGVAGTIGYVYEPGAVSIIPMDTFFSRFFHGFNFAESAYSAINSVKWMFLVIGDPLYNPFKNNKLDGVAPAINITSPQNEDIVYGEGVQIEGTATDNSETIFFLNNYHSSDLPYQTFQYFYPVNNGQFSYFYQLAGVSGYDSGNKVTINVSATDSSANTGEDAVTFTWVYMPEGVTPPAFKNLTQEITKGETESIYILLEAWCLPDDVLKFSTIETLPQGARILQSLPQQAVFLWTPGYNQAGVYNITFKVADNKGGVGTASVKFTINDIKLAISDVAATNITHNSAIITWKTERPASSSVPCRTTGESRYHSCGSDDSLTISHSILITNLTPNTTYFYKVSSRDAEGKAALSDEYSFTTLALSQEAPPELEPEPNLPYPEGTLIKSYTDPKVYVLLAGQRCWIPDPATFQTKGYNWSKVIQVNSSVLEQYAQGPNVYVAASPPAVSATLLRTQAETKVYQIISGQRLWIPTAESFNSLGLSWNNISISSASQVQQYPRLSLAKTSSSPKVYYLTEAGQKRHIPSPEVFVSYGNRWKDIVELSQTYLDAYPDNELIRLEGGSKVYLLQNGIKRWIRTAEVFNQRGYDWTKIAPVNQTELDSYLEEEEIK